MLLYVKMFFLDALVALTLNRVVVVLPLLLMDVLLVLFVSIPFPDFPTAIDVPLTSMVLLLLAIVVLFVSMPLPDFPSIAVPFTNTVVLLLLLMDVLLVLFVLVPLPDFPIDVPYTSKDLLL